MNVFVFDYRAIDQIGLFRHGACRRMGTHTECLDSSRGAARPDCQEADINEGRVFLCIKCLGELILQGEKSCWD